MNRHANGPAPRALFLGALTCVSLCWAALALAQSSETQRVFDIPALPLSQALQEFAKQATLQYGYIPSDPEEEKIVVHPVKGRYTVEQALAILLPEGFTFAWVNSRTISVLSPPANVPPGGVNESVAAKDQPRSELSKEQQLSMAHGGGKSGSARDPRDWDVLVEASRITFGTLDFDVPVTVMDREQIRRLGASTVTDLFRYLTQQTHTMSGSFLGDGTQFADLRGLGFDTTLVLINGHRPVATASSLTVNAFDLNSIPLGAVERVEIVSDSTSAMHGADAIGGVVNIVLRQDVPQPTLDIDYGAAAGGAVERHSTFSASGAAGRAKGTIVLDYFDRSPLFGRERGRWNNQDFSRFGSIDWRSPTASPGNVSSATLDNLPGLPATFAAIPGNAGDAALTPADFLPTAGQRNLESLYKYQPVSDEGTRKSLVAQGEFGFAPGTRAFGEFLYVDREIANSFEPPALSSTLVPRTNPYNPFDEDVLVDLLLTDLGPRTATRHGEMMRTVGGARGVFRGWNWEASLHNTRDDVTTLRANELDPERVTAALAETDAENALNVFGGSGANSPDLLASLLAAPSRSSYHTQATQAMAHLRGIPISLPTGAVELMAGGEWRQERAHYRLTEPEHVTGSHQRTVSAAFGEVRVPLVNVDAKVPAVHELSLVLSGRFDDYSDVGDSFNPAYALIWRPASSWLLRASWAQSFRPPPLFDLYAPLVDARVPTADPARNGEFSVPIWRAGGNPDLKPSNADSFTTTLQFAPHGATGMRIAATYWQIHVDETIKIPSAARILAAEDQFAGRIVRGERSAADIAAGIPGPLELIDVTRLNYGSIDTSGIDLSASTVLDTPAGRFAPSISATWTRAFVTSDLVEGPDVNRVGIANAQGSVPRWRAIMDVRWSWGGLGASSTLRHIPAYDDVDALSKRNGRRVGPQTLIDAQLSLDLGEMVDESSAWNGIEIRLGVLNLLNDEPPFAEVDWLNGYDLSQGDLRQRFAYLKLTKKF